MKVCPKSYAEGNIMFLKGTLRSFAFGADNDVVSTNADTNEKIRE